MRARTLWLAGLLAAGLTLTPASSRAQEAPLFAGGTEAQPPPGGDGAMPDWLTVRAQTDDGAIPEVQNPAPLWHNPANKGGFYAATSFVFFRQTNPLNHQPIGFRGFWDADGSITGTPGTFVGDKALVLDAKDAGGPGTYVPGLKVDIGYKFRDGSSFEVEWFHLQKYSYFHIANIIPPNFQFNDNNSLANSFVSAPVYNFDNTFAGNPTNVAVGNPGATFGIWNAASQMLIRFDQRTEEIQAKMRIPMFYNDDFGYRMYGLAGPRFFWIWERFYWRTVSQDLSGNADATDVGIYTNIVSNRMYGAYCGVGNEWYIGHGFACNLDLEAAGLLDIVKERAKYELGDKSLPGQVKRAKTDYTFVPELSASLNLTWYPIEGIEVRLGYDLMAFANTIAASHPVSFNVGALDPPWNRQLRFFDGLQAGIGFIF